MANNPYGSPGLPAENEVWSKRQEPKGGFGCLKGCMLGCGGFVVLAIIAGLVVYLNFEMDVSQDSVAARAMLREIVGCDPPEGYDTPFGAKFSIFKYAVTTVAIAPAGVEAKEEEELEQSKHSFFMVFQIPGVTAKNMQMQGKGNAGGESQTVEVSVGGEKTNALRTVDTQDGKKVVQYMVFLKTNTFMIASGPEESFDKKAFDAFLTKVKTD